jgi:hypothetical protein
MIASPPPHLAPDFRLNCLVPVAPVRPHSSSSFAQCASFFELVLAAEAVVVAAVLAQTLLLPCFVVGLSLSFTRRVLLGVNSTGRSPFSNRFLLCSPRLGLPALFLLSPVFDSGGAVSLDTTRLAFSIIAMALQFGHVTRTPLRVTTLSAVACARYSRRHARQKVWVQGKLTGWSKGSRQMEHFGTVEVSGSALLERVDPLAAVARLRRLGMLVDRRHRVIARESRWITAAPAAHKPRASRGIWGISRLGRGAAVTATGVLSLVLVLWQHSHLSPQRGTPNASASSKGGVLLNTTPQERPHCDNSTQASLGGFRFAMGARGCSPVSSPPCGARVKTILTCVQLWVLRPFSKRCDLLVVPSCDTRRIYPKPSASFIGPCSQPTQCIPLSRSVLRVVRRKNAMCQSAIQASVCLSVTSNTSKISAVLFGCGHRVAKLFSAAL